MSEVKKVKKKHLNFKGLILVLLIVYLIGMFFYTFFTMPIKNIYIKGTKLISDNEIIEVAGIKKYPSIFKISKKSLSKKIKSLELVKGVSITKKLNGKLIIEIDEAYPLFYNRNNGRVVLSNEIEVENKVEYIGIPSLVNYTPSDILKRFIASFSNIDTDIIAMINEIVYDPDISEDITIDKERFLLRMNDGNLAYVNILNMKRLNDYSTIFAAINEKGTVYLDSYSEGNGNILFTAFSDNKKEN